MELTQELLLKYIGGQLVLANTEAGYLKRGDIKEIKLQGEPNNQELFVSFAWFAKNRGQPLEPGDDWVKINAQDLTFKLKNCEIADEGEGRISLWNPVLCESAVLILPDDELRIGHSEILMKYTYAICRALNGDGRERLICCLNSEELPPFNEDGVALQVTKHTRYRDLPKLKERLRQIAEKSGLKNVRNLEPQSVAKGDA